MGSTIGLLLAAGAGRRMGMPKALVRDEADVPWIVSSVHMLIAGGCADPIVVIGAEAEAVRPLLAGMPVRIVEASDWATGMSASLAAGLNAAADSDADAVLIHLVDLPDVGADVIVRLLTHSTPDVLARAAYGAGPGHPVLVGREHWAAICAESGGDRGARGYLGRHAPVEVDCSDLATGRDVDTPGPMLEP